MGPTLREAEQTRRLQLFAPGSEGLNQTEVLRLAAQQAAAAVNGLGAMVHLPQGDSLRLGAMSGFPRSSAQGWEQLRLDEPSIAPVRAAQEHRPAQDRTQFGADPHSSDQQDTLIVSIPIENGDKLHAVLSVLSAQEKISDKDLNFLTQLAHRAAICLDQMAPPLSNITPAWWQEASGSPLEQAMSTIGVATWDWNLVTNELILDAGAQKLVHHVSGVSPEEWDGQVETWMSRVHPDDLPGVLKAIEHSIATRSVYSLEYRVVDKEGRVHWVELRGHPTYAQDGTPMRMIGTGWDKTETKLAQNSAVQVLQYMSDAFLVLDENWNVVYANAPAERLFSTTVLGNSLWNVIPSTPQFAQQFRDAVLTGKPTSADMTVEDRIFHLRLVPVKPGATIYATDVTEERQQENAAAQRADQLGHLTVALAQALQINEVIDAISEHGLRPLGASGMVMPVFSSGSIRPIAMIGYSEELEIILNDLGDSITEATGWPRSKDTAEFVPSLYELTCRYPKMADMARDSGMNAWAFLPMLSGGKYAGHLVISFPTSREFTNDEKTLLIALSGMSAQALERARLYDEAHNKAQQLQRGLLPHALPTLSAVTAAARYLPAGGSSNVGGDWYDTIPLSAGRVALVIGDVLGHGLNEAITMGRIRAAVATIAGMDYPPNELLAHINDVASSFETDRYATCLYAIYDSTTGTCSIASAGHPAPAVAYPDGTVTYPKITPGLPLGVAQQPYEITELQLPPGSTLIMYTDGLVESVNGDMKRGMDSLAETLNAVIEAGVFNSNPELEMAHLEKLCDTITGVVPDMSDGHERDDAALLAVRTHVLPESDVISWQLPDEPVAAGQARRLVREQLTRWHLEELITSTELVASELVGNVIRHATGPIGLRLILNTTLTCEVKDGSEATPRIRHASVMDENGRGLQLVAIMTKRWGTRYTPGGKCIWAEQDLPKDFRQ
ncbi:MAG: SpoIIE family protein phosphatase [Corynebacteriales bacterium]|nr:SpoIIE family protein phosphatase [Mycobacteriales bacterium]